CCMPAARPGRESAHPSNVRTSQAFPSLVAICLRNSQRSHQIRDRGFGSGVDVTFRRAEPIVSGTGVEIDHRHTQAVDAVEPVQAAPHSRTVRRVARDAVRGQVGCGERGYLDRLLVAAVLQTVVRTEAEVTDVADWKTV